MVLKPHNARLLEALPPFLLMIIFGLLYGGTLARNLFLEDSAEFITASLTLSIPHPSGYPLYILASKLFALIPLFDSVVLQYNFFSMALTMCAIIAAYYAFKRLFKNSIIAFSLALLFGMSPSIWVHATYAEVYALNTLLLALMLLLYTHYRAHRRIRTLYALAFVFGLGASNHFLILAATPVCIAFLVRSVSWKKNKTTFLKVISSFTVGLLPYIYIPIRSTAGAAFSWFNGDLGKLLSYNIPTGHWVSSHTVRYVSDIFTTTASSYSWFGIILLVAGMIILFHRKHPERWILFSTLLLFSVGMLVLLVGRQEYTQFASWFYKQLHGPFLLFALIPIGVVLTQMYESRYRMWLFYTVLLALLIWPVSTIGDRYATQDRSSYTFFEEYTKQILDSLDGKTPLFVHHDHIMNDTLVFGLGYQRYIKQVNVIEPIYSLTPIFLPPNDFPRSELPEFQGRESRLVSRYITEHPYFYTSFPVVAWHANGYAYGSFSQEAQNYFTPPNLFDDAANNNPYHQSLVAKYYYDHAAHAFDKGSLKSGQWFLIQAIEYDPETFSDYYKKIVALRDAYLKN